MNDQEWMLDIKESCKNNFGAFCQQCVKIPNHLDNSIPFDLHDFQKRFIKMWEDHSFVIGTKFRQGGFTTVSLIHQIWKSIYCQNHKGLFLAKQDRWARDISDQAKRIISGLPESIRPGLRRCNEHFIELEETRSQLHFCTPLSCLGSSIDNLIVDEAAFGDDFENVINSCMLSPGCKVLAISTPSKKDNWFKKTYRDAVEGKNKFVVFRADYTEHPEFRDKSWASNMRKNLGEKGWQQEIEQQFC